MVAIPFSRRTMMKWSAAVGGAAALTGAVAVKSPEEALAAETPALYNGEKVVWSACTVNCGSRCPVRLVVKEGVVTRVLPDNTGDDTLENRTIRSCLRGRSIRQRMYSPDRLKTPLKRKPGTKRGAGEWEEISWEQALDEVAAGIDKFRKDPQYGPQSVHVIYGTGTTAGNMTRRNPLRSLLAASGGYLDYQADYSTAQITAATPYTYGGGVFVSTEVKKADGVRTIIIDPRYTDTALVIGDQWVPIRPGTDAALVAGISHVLYSENMIDQKFCDKYVVGHDEEHMPKGVPAGNSYMSYVLGEGSVHTVAKTPEWASKIMGFPRRRLSRWRARSDAPSRVQSPRAGARSGRPTARTTPARSSTWRSSPASSASPAAAPAPARARTASRSPGGRRCEPAAHHDPGLHVVRRSRTRPRDDRAERVRAGCRQARHRHQGHHRARLEHPGEPAFRQLPHQEVARRRHQVRADRVD